MKCVVYASLCLILLCGCSSVRARKQEKSAAYVAFAPAEQQLVSQGQIDRGMDTNAVYIAWGKPSAVSTGPSTDNSGLDERWVYYGDRPVLTPGWAYRPQPYGYWSLEYYPEHRSEWYVQAEVLFHNGKVVDWKRY